MEEVLDEAILHEPGRKTMFKVLQFFLLFTLLYLAIDIYMEIKNVERLSAVSLAMTCFFILIPFIGWILLWLKSKLGWIMSLFFYGLLGTLTGADSLNQIMNRHFMAGVRSSDIYTYLLFATSASCIVFLSLKEIRAHLSISPKMHAWNMSIFGVLYSFLFILLLKIGAHY